MAYILYIPNKPKLLDYYNSRSRGMWERTRIELTILHTDEWVLNRIEVSGFPRSFLSQEIQFYIISDQYKAGIRIV